MRASRVTADPGSRAGPIGCPMRSHHPLNSRAPSQGPLRLSGKIFRKILQNRRRVVICKPSTGPEANKPMKTAPIYLTPDQARRNSVAVIRAQLAVLARGNVQRVQAWLDQVAETDPAEALNLFLRMLEFSVPKLSRAEVAITDDTKDGVAHLTIADLQALLREAQTIQGECAPVVEPGEIARLTAVS